MPSGRRAPQQCASGTKELVRDQGHADPNDAPMALRIACAALARASVLEEAIAARVAEMGGPLTSDGRVRRAHQRWEAVFDRVLSALRVVGLERAPGVAPTLEQILRGEDLGQANPEEGGGDDAQSGV